MFGDLFYDPIPFCIFFVFHIYSETTNEEASKLFLYGVVHKGNLTP
jgi:hypothetical protein